MGFGAHVQINRAAAACVLRALQLDAELVEHAQGGGVDIGRHARLHAAFEHNHFARPGALRNDAGGFSGHHFAAQLLRQPRPQGLRHAVSAFKRGSVEHQPAQGFAPGFFRQRAADLLFHFAAADVEQMAVFHARGAGGFAIAAGEAAVEVGLNLHRGAHAFEHLFDLINAPARAVELIAGELVSGACGVAKAAMHAVFQNGVGNFAVRCVFDEIGQMGLHGDCFRFLFSDGLSIFQTAILKAV